MSERLANHNYEDLTEFEYPNQEFLLDTINLENLGDKKQGKVKDIYEVNDKLILISTDRFSAFDKNLTIVPYKGEMLTQLTKYWFNQTEHIVPNHAIDYPDPNVLIAKKCNVIPLEFCVREYLTGSTSTSLWQMYKNGRNNFDGITPNFDQHFNIFGGLSKNKRLTIAPVITITTKDKDHDIPINSEEIVDQGILTENQLSEIAEVCFNLFNFTQKKLNHSGLIMADTKYEFGYDKDGILTLVDEINTSDSSRIWLSQTYKDRISKNEEPFSLDKEFIRLWYKEHGEPDFIPEDIRVEQSSRFIKYYEMLTGEIFIPNDSLPITERIKLNLDSYFSN